MAEKISEVSETKDLLQKKLDVLKKNLDNIPKSERSRYKKAFAALVNEIQMLVYQMMKEIVFYYFVRPENRDLRKMFMILFKESEVNRYLAAFEADGVEEELNMIHDKIWDELHKRNDFTYSEERCSIDPFNPQKIIFSKDTVKTVKD